MRCRSVSPNERFTEDGFGILDGKKLREQEVGGRAVYLG